MAVIFTVMASAREPIISFFVYFVALEAPPPLRYALALPPSPPTCTSPRTALSSNPFPLALIPPRRRCAYVWNPPLSPPAVPLPVQWRLPVPMDVNWDAAAACTLGGSSNSNSNSTLLVVKMRCWSRLDLNHTQNCHQIVASTTICDSLWHW